jgi:dTDP-glucose 4,6-dehydratase
LLVTGGAGFIGTNFAQHWMARHPEDRLVVLDALTYAGDLANLEPVMNLPAFRFVHGDVCDADLIESLLRSERLDTIVHFAAESHVDRSIEGPDVFVQTNVVGTHSLLKAARRVWLEESSVPAHRFHHVSTDEVYGSLSPADPAFTESTPYAPNSPYSASKAASDHLVRAYHHTFGLETTISNCSNNYGPYQYPEKLIPVIINCILQGQPLPIYGDGKNVRDWLHVEDHCRGIESVLQGGKPGETYNIGGRSELENIRLVRTLCDIMDERFRARPELPQRYPLCPPSRGARSSSLIAFVKDRLGHDRRYAIDCSKIERECGFSPQIDLARGLRSTVEWYLRRQSPPAMAGQRPTAGTP